MHRIHFVLVFLFFAPRLLWAQTGTVTGTLRDELHQPAPFVNVVLLNPVDSVQVQGTATDANGQFTLSLLPLRNYVLITSAIGYQRVMRSLTLSAAQPVFVLLPITLIGSQQVLGEVTVKGHPPLMQVDGDKLIMNVAASATQAGLNGLELLEKVPGVTVNRSTELVALRNQTPLILIDDRPTHLTPEQLTGLLKTMRSDEVATIEVIQNPSARYEAAGAGGIINIRTKKSQKYGALYTLQLGGAYGHFGGLGATPQHNEGITFSRRSRRTNIYIGFTNDYTQSIGEQQNDQNLIVLGQLTEQRVGAYRSRDLAKSQRLTANTEWTLTPRLTLSVQVQNIWSRDQYVQDLRQKFVTASSSTGLDTDYRLHSRQNYFTLSTQLQQRFDTLGRQLTVAFDGARVNNTLQSTFAYKTYKSASPGQTTLSTNQLNSPFVNPIFTGRADYVHPTRLGRQWEAGAKIIFANNRNTFESDFLDGQPRQEYFRFQETIGAGYAQWSGNWHRYKVQAGLRAEQTAANGFDQQDQLVVKRSYLNFFPSASISHPINDKQQLTLAYSRRIDRPNYYQFSPFQRFTSRFEYIQGNAELSPYITNSYSLRHVFKDAIVTTFSYDRAPQIYSAYYTLDQTTILGQTLIRNTFVNTKPKQVAHYNLNGTVPLDPARWLHLDLSYWYAYQVYQNEVVEDYVDFHASSFGGDATASITLPKAVVLEIAVEGNSGYAMGAFERSKPTVSVDLGARKTFAHQRGTLKLNLSDPFDLYRYNVRINSPELQAFNQNRITNRLVRLQLTYNIGNKQASTNSRSTTVQESTKRSGNSPR